MATVSVIMTVVERPEPLDALYREYAAVLESCGRSYEFIFVAHPFFHELLEPLLALAEDASSHSASVGRRLPREAQ